MRSRLLVKGDVCSTVSEKEAREAVKTLIKWIGENPEREGLLDTPQRVLDSFKEHFSGYHENPVKVLKKTFTETSGYQDMILLKDIEIYSHCEHHIAPITGTVHIAYCPDTKVVGISKLARVVEIYSKRLQIQERLTAEIANTINSVLKPKGVAVQIEAHHSCINNRGITKKEAKMKTHTLLGCFRDDMSMTKRFFKLLSS